MLNEKIEIMETTAPQNTPDPGLSDTSNNPPLASASANVDPPSFPARSNRRNGKVARLPYDTRQLVNLMLRDGHSYPDIIKKLDNHGHKLKPDNLSNWHTGGYQDWLREQTFLEDTRARLAFASEIASQENGEYIEAASLRIAVIRMYNLITEFDPEVLKAKIAHDPAAYTRILNALCKLTRGSLDFERLRAKKNKN